MQFSIFGVPFKCTKDMFIQDKVLWTIYIFWAQFWRLLLVFLGAGLSVVAYFYFTEHHFSGFENFSISSLLSIAILGILLYGVIIYVQYYVYFEKSFQSFKQEFLKDYKPKFWSWGFWKPFLIIAVITFIVDFIIGSLLSPNITNGLIFIFGLFFQHICLHGETWGFKLVAKTNAQVNE